jgi:hypothetical protein
MWVLTSQLLLRVCSLGWYCAAAILVYVFSLKFCLSNLYLVPVCGSF